MIWIIMLSQWQDQVLIIDYWFIVNKKLDLAPPQIEILDNQNSLEYLVQKN